MKGIVFTEFLEFVSDRFGEDMADDIIEASDLPSGGAYTSVGTYDHSEMVMLLGALCHKTAMAQETALRTFGIHLGKRFAQMFPDFFSARQTLFDFLASVDHHIHVEVRKLYPDAELPAFVTYATGTHRMMMEYRSSRHLELLAEGLILGAAHFYATEITVNRRNRKDNEGDFVEFTIEMVP